MTDKSFKKNKYNNDIFNDNKNNKEFDLISFKGENVKPWKFKKK